MRNKKSSGRLKYFRYLILFIFSITAIPASMSTFAVADDAKNAKGAGADADLDDLLNAENDANSKSSGVKDGVSEDGSVADLEKSLDSEPGSEEATKVTEKSVAESPAVGSPEDMKSLEDEIITADKSRKSKGGASREASGAFEIPEGDAKSASNRPAPEAMPESTEPETPDDGSPNQITNLEFKTEGDVARIIVSSKKRLKFRETRSAQTKQVIYQFENTGVPDKLQRAYDTTEFASSVGLFTLLQMPKSNPPSSKLIVQLRETQPPTARPSDRSLIIEFPNGTADSRVAAGEVKDMLSNDNIYGQVQRYGGQAIRRLEIKNSDVQDVLRLIARSSGYSVVVGDDVTGKIGTLSLENIPWDQAFTLVLQSKKLGYVRDGNVLRVASLQSLKSEKDEALAIENAKSKIEPLKTLLIPISFAKADEISAKVKNFLTERGSVDTDIRSNTVIVKDAEKSTNRIQKLVSALDIQPPRVAVSAKIVEINSSFSRNMGFSNLAVNTPLGGNTISQALNMSVSGSSITNFSAPGFANLAATLELAELENKGKTLANPSVSVVANQTGTVSQSLSFFVPQNTIVGGAVSNSLRQITATLSLAVTPIVAGDGSIFMKVAINNDIPKLDGANSTINQRSIDTQVLMENGDTAVIGGIFSNTVTNTKEGIPFLMRIPILGFLLSRTAISDTRNEIFIFLTAKVTNAEESLKRTI